VVAYQGDYAAAREELKVIDATARAKNCDAPRVPIADLTTRAASWKDVRIAPPKCKFNVRDSALSLMPRPICRSQRSCYSCAILWYCS
jgi:hypothetical protein